MTRRAASLALVCAALFGLLGWLDGFSLFEVLGYQLARRDVPDPLRNAAGYAATWALCWIGLGVLLCHAWRAVRWLGLALSVLTATTFVAFARLNEQGFTYHEASLVWSESSQIGGALLFFLGEWALPLTACLVLAFAYERFAVPRLALLRSAWVLAVPLVAIPAQMRMLEATHSKVYQTPVPYRVPGLLHYAWRFRTLYTGPRDEPKLSPVNPPLADHLVLVMDESVRGDLLGLNGAPYETTPRLEALTGRFVNYGVAASPSNLSSTTNIIVQSGLRPDQVPDTELRSLRNPSLFAFMERAGFRPFLVDAQIYSDKPTNFMTRRDLDSLAGIVFVRRENPGLREYEMDFAAIDTLVAIVAKEERSFTHVFKTGAHFPYEDKYDPSVRLYEPTLRIGEVTRGREEMLHSYLNALRWTVDAFLAELLARLDATGERVLVVYTADHGQSLLEPGPDGRPHTGFPHATVVDPPIEQARVPLVLLGAGDGVMDALRERYDPARRDRSSGFEIFSTLLEAAGYAPGEVAAHHVPSLFDRGAARPPRVFVSGNLFGQGSPYQNRIVRRASSANLNAFDPAPPGAGAP